MNPANTGHTYAGVLMHSSIITVIVLRVKADSSAVHAATTRHVLFDSRSVHVSMEDRISYMALLHSCGAHRSTETRGSLAAALTCMLSSMPRRRSPSASHCSPASTAGIACAVGRPCSKKGLSYSWKCIPGSRLDLPSCTTASWRDLRSNALSAESSRQPQCCITREPQGVRCPAA